jgi:riboflavin kinase/FMN adenylyltransferase
MVLTFEPHPTRFFDPNNAPKMLNTQRFKITLIKEIGLEILLSMHFNHKLAELEPETFVKEILHERIRAKAVLVGFNFTFGKHGAGDADVLMKMGKIYGFEVEIVPPVFYQGHLVSSSLIREALSKGNVDLARQLLSYWPVLEGTVVQGFGRGKDIGFPTANLRIEDDILIPASGTYAATTKVDNNSYKSVLNIGCCPTFANPLTTVETHLINFNGNLYGKQLKVQLHKRLRSEQKFYNVNELKDQILKDIAETEFI